VLSILDHPGCDALGAYRHVIHENPLLLHSSVTTGQRWSVLCLNPLSSVTVNLSEAGSNPFARLCKTIKMQNEKFCLTGGEDNHLYPGWFGFLSYDLGKFSEESLASLRIDPDFPLAEFTLYGVTLVYDNEKKTWSGFCLNIPQIPAAEELLQKLLHRLRQSAPTENDVVTTTCPKTECSSRSYQEMVKKALAYIEQGDVYQVCLSRRYEARFTGSGCMLAHQLLSQTPAAYGAIVPVSNGRKLISTSPELFLQKRGRMVQTKPIKGTRPRAVDAEEDKRLHEELSACEKERAELAMITDLLRNDLSKVCTYGSVQVKAARVLETYPHVRHAFSVVAGVLRQENDWEDLLRATFPGGSITGAPKIRAMQIIGELEGNARGPYCGSIGRIGLGADPNLDLNIAIRTVRIEGQSLLFDVGSGIVADSDPAAEDAETIHKARGIFHALGHEVSYDTDLV